MANSDIIAELNRYKQKFYTNALIRGSLISAILIISIFLIFSVLESYFWFDSQIRAVILIMFIGLLFYLLATKIAGPIMALLKLKKGISNEKAAKEIGQHFPEIKDKLLNYLQLTRLNEGESTLVAAALSQKTNELKIFKFRQAINLNVNKRYALYFFGVIMFLMLVSFINPGMFESSSTRIIQFNKKFEKPAPFKFLIVSGLEAFKGDKYILKVQIEGSLIPEGVSVVENGRNVRMLSSADGFSLTYPSLNTDRSFYLEAAGYSSKQYEIKVIRRPEIQKLKLEVDYPDYINEEDRELLNIGSVIVPEGSNLNWIVNSSDTEIVTFVKSGDSVEFKKLDNQQFAHERLVKTSFTYSIGLENEYSSNKAPIVYEVSVIKDRAPEIEVDYLPDTISYRSLIVSGNISDDYGFRSLSLFYKTSEASDFKRVAIPYKRNQANQQFFYQWFFDSLQIGKNKHLEAFIRVTDNDRVNGFKSTDSERFWLKMPDEEEKASIISKNREKSQNKFEEASETAKDLKEKIEDLEDRLKNKKDLDWKDKKTLDEILRERKELEEKIEELKEQHEALLESEKEFGKQNKKIQEKAQKLQELLEEVLDEETKKLYDELQELLKQKSQNDEVMDQLSKIKNKEQNLEQELERALELFKRMKFESILEQSAQELGELAEKQESLSEESSEEDQNGPDSSENSSNEDTQSKQQEIEKKFEEIKQNLDEAEKLNDDLKNPHSMEDFERDEEKIDESLEQISEEMEQNNSQRTKQQMKKAANQMQRMAQKMGQMQQGMEMTMMQENLDHLRDILDNLIKLSFNQEAIINNIAAVEQIDPRFIELSQDQLELVSGAEVIQDSLLSLAERVVQISNFVTREINEINFNLERAMDELRERNKNSATSYQQYAMASMNNLALLLDDVMSQMQMAMAESMGNPQKGGQKQMSMPGMSEMQKQLSKQIEELKKSGKSGRALSEELAKLAAQQGELRRQLQEMQKELNGRPGQDFEKPGGGGVGKGLKEAIEKMEENEVDLVNKRLTNTLIERQQEILTRMLEAEESLREQKQSPEREGETASGNENKVPPAIEEYLKAKKSQIELLKTIPLDLNPFYKKEANDYFRRLSEEEI